ncbi:MAG: hypothetical protein E6R13_09545 [Spirochaetes bacterium]|nr:MAG: hypothetical protein E6R13_09545 [Spirochaetota bacterium]
MTKNIKLESAEGDEENTDRTTAINPVIALTYIAQKNKFKGTYPTYNYILLRESRIKEYSPALDKFKQERKFKELDTTGFDIACFYFMWLKAELTNCETIWQSKASNSDNLEVFKYKNWIQNEMISAEIKIQSYSDQVYNFRWNHREDKAEVVHGKLIKGGFIDSKTTIETFKSIFGLLPSQVHQRIIWTKEYRNQPHRQALRDFLNIATGETVSKRTVEATFSDKKGNPISITKGKGFSKFISDFEKMF